MKTRTPPPYFCISTEHAHDFVFLINLEASLACFMADEAPSASPAQSDHIVWCIAVQRGCIKAVFAPEPSSVLCLHILSCQI